MPTPTQRTIPSSVPETPRQRVQHQINHDAAVKWLNLDFIHVSDDGLRVRMPVLDQMRNGFGIVHGGFPYLLGDTAFAFTGTAAGTPIVTHQANVTYTAPASGEHLEAESRLLHRYGRNVICEVTVRDEGGPVVAYMSVHGVVSKKLATTRNSRPFDA